MQNTSIKNSAAIGKEKSSSIAGPIQMGLGLLALVVLFYASVILIRKADHSKPADWNEDKLTYLPSGKILKPMVMDLDEAAADLLWVNGMIYFSGAYFDGKSYEWMGHILDIVTILNPRFKPAYEFGGVVLTKKKSEIPITLLLLDRGIEEFPHDWQLRVFAAVAQITLDSNFLKAADYLKPISLEPNVPDYIRTLSATFMNKGGDKRMALAFLVDLYFHAENKINREIFVDKILTLYPNTKIDIEIRKMTVEKILNEGKYVPPNMEPFIIGVIHEYLNETMTLQTQALMNKLYP